MSFMLLNKIQNSCVRSILAIEIFSTNQGCRKIAGLEERLALWAASNFATPRDRIVFRPQGQRCEAFW